MSEDLQHTNEESQLSPGAPGDAPRIDRSDWGFDPPTFDAMMRLAQVLYQRYWRVDARGLEHIPAQGSAMLVPNHSGQFPFDAMMIATAVYTQHPHKRLVRNLYGTWFARLPFGGADAQPAGAGALERRKHPAPAGAGRSGGGIPRRL